MTSEDVRFDGGLSGEPYCACGRVVSMCDRSRAGCTRRSRADAGIEPRTSTASLMPAQRNPPG
jgi:hypothetical protein